MAARTEIPPPLIPPTALVSQACGCCGFTVIARSLEAVKANWTDHDWYRAVRKKAILPVRMERDDVA